MERNLALLRCFHAVKSCAEFAHGLQENSTTHHLPLACRQTTCAECLLRDPDVKAPTGILVHEEEQDESRFERICSPSWSCALI
jgi:hypothetical protein